MPTIIIGTIFFVLVALAARKTYRNLRSNTCPGCSAGCGLEKREKCHKGS
ncbi:FeoB-associated Cys-rich membrane protein [Anaerotalea alkaliphila]|uniref:FeoB-associated Cys-rich membrane protein n=1 Tax=Anaerotalea alkaliphila TaxID=2662126 RepID=A0A7X5HTN3_9FIRM|nr:FeoB-associated Cys-rich membrane protein [Anaerotalea alkaliphila]NDL66465.1 FeoB-associated Cys-rich membrane protein [Anaerotalea alkaliphila]